MADSYIDLNVEHYLRNGELKGAVKDLNTIINGEGSNKSLTELVEDLKVALNYANWGYWSGNSEPDKRKIKPLREAVKRVVSETDFTFTKVVPIVHKGQYMYISFKETLGAIYKERCWSYFNSRIDSICVRIPTEEVLADRKHYPSKWFLIIDSQHRRDHEFSYQYKYYTFYGNDKVLEASSNNYINFKDIPTTVIDGEEYYKIGKRTGYAKDIMPKDCEIKITKESVRLVGGETVDGHSRSLKWDLETQERVKDFD